MVCSERSGKRRDARHRRSGERHREGAGRPLQPRARDRRRTLTRVGCRDCCACHLSTGVQASRSRHYRRTECSVSAYTRKITPADRRRAVVYGLDRLRSEGRGLVNLPCQVQDRLDRSESLLRAWVELDEIEAATLLSIWQDEQ